MGFLWDLAEQLWDVTNRKHNYSRARRISDWKIVCPTKYTGDVVWRWFQTEVRVWKEEGVTP